MDDGLKSPQSRALRALDGLVASDRLETAWAEHLKRRESVVRILCASGVVDEAELLEKVGPRLGLAYARLNPDSVQPEALKKLDAGIATHYGVMPLRIEDGRLAIAASDPFAWEAFDELREIVGMELEIVLATREEIDLVIRKRYGLGADTAAQMAAEEGIELHSAVQSNGDLADETASADASVMKFVNLLLLEAIKAGATDIHIEPYERDLCVRYRVDGFLHETSIPPTMWHFRSAIAARVKIMANLDIAEKRLPQEGRIDVSLGGNDYDLRVSVLPGSYGEAVNLRILPRGAVLIGLEQLGLSRRHLEMLDKLIRRPHGIILVTGPTGSGKTTTLYAALHKINTPEKKILTVEDPIEYDMRGIVQMQVHPRIGFDFARALRSILRHDPNVILVGEVRDRETADIAIRTALTGHLVFTTLHTNDAAGAITRLLDMGIEPFLCSSSILAIMAQRLVRRVCLKCKRELPVDDRVIREMGISLNSAPAAHRTAWEGAGCADCRFTGYRGRTAIHEILLMDDEIREMTLAHVPANQIKAAARRKGMKTLREDGLEKVFSGLTTFQEIARVTQEEEETPREAPAT
jgi:type II secretion system protein E